MGSYILDCKEPDDLLLVPSVAVSVVDPTGKNPASAHKYLYMRVCIYTCILSLCIRTHIDLIVMKVSSAHQDAYLCMCA